MLCQLRTCASALRYNTCMTLFMHSSVIHVKLNTQQYIMFVCIQYTILCSTHLWFNHTTMKPLFSLLVSTFQLHVAVGIPVKIHNNCSYIFATMGSNKLKHLSLLRCAKI